METINQTHLTGVRSKRRIRSAEEMYPIVESWLESNLSQKAFCQGRGVKLHLLSYWARRYDQEKNDRSNPQESSMSAMIPLQIQSRMDAAWQYALEITYPDGTRLWFGRMIEFNTLQALLSKRQ